MSTATHPLAKALAGDQAAWRSIVEDHTKLLWWVARSYRLDEATSGDVIQTVWMQLLRFGHRIDNPERLSSWLVTTARREALRRTSARDIPTEDIADRSDPSVPSAEERVIDDELRSTVLAAFAKLSEEDQTLLQLLCDEPPKSYDEIAAILGKSHGYIGPTRQRALTRLRQLVKEMGIS